MSAIPPSGQRPHGIYEYTPSSLLKLVSIPCRTSALVRQCGGLGNSVESLNISYGKRRYRVELFGS